MKKAGQQTGRYRQGNRSLSMDRGKNLKRAVNRPDSSDCLENMISEAGSHDTVPLGNPASVNHQHIAGNIGGLVAA